MKFSLRFLPVVFLLTIIGGAARAQGVTSSGTDYWLGFMPNGAGLGNQSVYEELYICSGTGNQVSISIAGDAARTIPMKAGQIYDYQLSNFMTSTPEVPTENAIHITSTSPITVYGYSAWGDPQGIGDSPDGYLGLPLEDFGTEYYTVNFPDNGVFGQNPFMPGEFLIISPYDNNIVTIMPAASTKTGRPAGIPWTDTLQKGQTYLVQSAGTEWGANDLTGTLIKSSKPIGVITGHQITSVPSDECCSADNLIEMVPSVDKWGTQYFDMPMAGKTVVGDYLRVLSAENGNVINYTGPNVGLQTMTLDSGQYQDITTNTDPLTLTSTNHKRFLVAQYSCSQGFDGDPGYSDPWMALFTPQEQFEKEMIFRTPTPDKGAFTNYLTIISIEDSVQKITINGLPLSAFPSAGHSVFPGTSPVMGAYRIMLDANPYNYVAKGPVPFAAYQYGFSNYEGYGWPTGMMQDMASGDSGKPIVHVLDSTGYGAYQLRISEDGSKLASVAMIMDSGDFRWPSASYNYTFTPDSNFIVGDSTYSAALSVIDTTKCAYAAIYAVDRAGKDTVFQYKYGVPLLSSSMSDFEFGKVALGSDSCTTITLQNSGCISQSLLSTGFRGYPAGGSFRVSPQTIDSIPPDSSVVINVCYTPSDTGIPSFDTLVLSSPLSMTIYPLSGIGYKAPPASVAGFTGTTPQIVIASTTTNFEATLSPAFANRLLVISDVLGRTVAKINVPSDATHIGVSLHLSPGTYFARMGQTIEKFEVVQ